MASPIAVSWEQVLSWRLTRQGLIAPFPGSVDAVRQLAGVQAQVPSAAVGALAVRARGAGGSALDAAAIDAALVTERTLVRTWAQRGTLHLLAAEDHATWVGALSTRFGRADAAWERYHGITADELEAITAAVPEVLAGRSLSRDELTAALVAALEAPHLAEPLRSGWGAALKPAAALGHLCHGGTAPDGGVTFARPVDWLGPSAPAPVPSEAAVGAVIAWFLAAHGPATVDDLARWFGVRPALAKRLWRDAALDVVPVEVDGTSAWIAADDADDLAAAAPVRGEWLLGAFDPWVLHPRSHRDVIVPADGLAAVSRPGGWISPILLVDGWVVATWKPETAGDVTRVAVTPLDAGRWPRAEAALPRLLDGLAQRLGTEVVRS